MDTVIARLKKIAEWERSARLPLISSGGLAALSRVGERQKLTTNIIEANAEARKQEKEALAAVKASFGSWLKDELDRTASYITEATQVPCQSVALSTDDENRWYADGGGQRSYVPLTGWELQIDETVGSFPRRHLLQFRLTQLHQVRIKVTFGGQVDKIVSEPAEDFQLAIIPYYRQGMVGQKGWNALGFLTIPGRVNTISGNVSITNVVAHRGPRVTQHRLSPVLTTFDAMQCQHIAFKMSQWPPSEEDRRAFINAALDSFIALVESTARA